MTHNLAALFFDLGDTLMIEESEEKDEQPGYTVHSIAKLAQVIGRLDKAAPMS